MGVYVPSRIERLIKGYFYILRWILFITVLLISYLICRSVTDEQLTINLTATIIFPSLIFESILIHFLRLLLIDWKHLKQNK
jgi:hypothetical protein